VWHYEAIQLFGIRVVLCAAKNDEIKNIEMEMKKAVNKCEMDKNQN
jgi:predicted regulator of Ras-like GTPase activity (Roadblock/LC7/MglB family)